MTFPENHPNAALLAELAPDIRVVPDAPGLVRVEYDCPELKAAGCNDYLPVLSQDDPDDIARAKLNIAITVGFIRREGVEAYRAQFPH